MDKETKAEDKNKPMSVRFDLDDKAVLRQAAKLEGLEPSPYVRRCTMVYTREHHPELFAKS